MVHTYTSRPTQQKKAQRTYVKIITHRMAILRLVKLWKSFIYQYNILIIKEAIFKRHVGQVPMKWCALSSCGKIQTALLLSQTTESSSSSTYLWLWLGKLFASRRSPLRRRGTGVLHSTCFCTYQISVLPATVLLIHTKTKISPKIPKDIFKPYLGYIERWLRYSSFFLFI